MSGAFAAGVASPCYGPSATATVTAAVREDIAGPPQRPQIVIGTDEMRVADEAVAALADADVYQRGGKLVHVISEPEARASILRPVGTPRLVLLPLPRLRELLADRIEWTSRRRNKETGEYGYAQTHPPEWVVKASRRAANGAASDRSKRSSIRRRCGQTAPCSTRPATTPPPAFCIGPTAVRHRSPRVRRSTMLV